MSRRKPSRIRAPLAAAALLWAGAAQASNIETLGIGARATALGGAFVAVADAPSAIYYNPAGLTQLLGDGRTVDQTMGVRLTSIKYGIRQPVTSAQSGLNPGGEVRNGFDHIFIQPDFPGGRELTDDLYIAPFAFTTPWGGFFRFDPNRGDHRFTGYEATQVFINYTPRIAWKATDWLSIGGGPDVQAFNKITRKAKFGDGYTLGGLAFNQGISKEEAGRLLGLLGVRPDGLDDGLVELETDKEIPTGVRPINDLNANWRDVGFTVGVHLRPVDWLRVGAVYRHRINAHVTGTAKTLFADDPVTLFIRDIAQSPLGPVFGLEEPPVDDEERFRLTFRLPAQLAGGVAVDITDWWMVTGDVVWTDWHVRQRDVTHYEGNGLGPPSFDLDNDPSTPDTGIKKVVVKRHLQSTLAWRIGTEFKITEELRVQMGYWNDPDPVSDKYYGIDAGVSDREYYSLGASLTGLFDGLLDVNAAFQHIVFHRRRVDVGESINLGGTKEYTNPVTDGQADNTDFAVSVGGKVQSFALECVLHW